METTTVVAQRLGISPRTLLRWLEAGALPGVRTPGGHWRVAPADVEAFLVGRTRGATVTRTRAPCVVVVEDNAQHALALVRLIYVLAPGVAVHQAADGLAAGLVIGTLTPDLVFIDIELPQLDGIELIRRVRGQPAMRDTRFAVVSGQLSDHRVAELRRLEVRHILPKPVAPAQLRSVLEDLLRKPSRRVERRRQGESMSDTGNDGITASDARP